MMHRASCSFWLKGHVGKAVNSSLSRTFLSHATPKLHLVAPINTRISFHLSSCLCSLRFCSTVSRSIHNKISLLANGKVSIDSANSSFNARFLFPTTAIRPDVLGQTFRLLSKASLAGTDTAVQSDLSLLIGKRITRRQRVKEIADRDQAKLYPTHAFATAEEYNLEDLTKDLKFYNYQLVNLPEDALDALYVQSKHPDSDEWRRIFFFREGSVVFWNVPKEEQDMWLQRLRAYQDGSYNLEMVREQEEQMDFCYIEDKTQLRRGEIELKRWTKCDEQAATQLDIDACNCLIVEALAQPESLVKLAIWEAMLNQYVDSIEVVLQDLKNGKKIRLSEAEVLRKAGELFTLSHLINVSSDLLDTPDFYWDREDLGRLYNKACNYLNTPRRTKPLPQCAFTAALAMRTLVMNEKLGQCVEIIELLRDHLKDKHHTRLEWMIIALIAVEVGFATFHLLEKHYFNDGNDR